MSSDPSDNSQNIGKWALPETNPADTAASAAAQTSQWKPPPSALRSNIPVNLGKWTREAPLHLDVPLSLHPNPAPRTHQDQWARPEGTQNHRPLQNQNRFKRDIAPHKTSIFSTPRSQAGLRTTDKVSDQHPRSLQEEREKEWTDKREKGKHDPRVLRRPILDNQIVEEDEDAFDTRAKDIYSGKTAKGDFKERGSIISKIADGMTIPGHSRVKLSHSARPKREKKYLGAPQKVSQDLFIPTLVSVGNLARLLNVRIG